MSKGERLELSFILDCRPIALKNSRTPRVTRKNGKLMRYSAVNPKAKARLEQAKYLLRQQHRGDPLDKQFDLTAVCYYSDNRSWLDTDALQTWVGDLLKGIVVIDDKPRYLRDWTGKPRLSRQGVDRVEIVLTEVL